MVLTPAMIIIITFQTYKSTLSHSHMLCSFFSDSCGVAKTYSGIV